MQDETTDRCGRYIAQLICVKMCIEPSHSLLIACWELEKADYSTTARLINDSFRNLWLDNDIFCEKILEFISNAFVYMVKATKPLKV